MKTFTANTFLTIAALAVAFGRLTTSEEVSFYSAEGSVFTVTITGGCYTFNPSLDKKAIAGEVDRGCFEVWDLPGCRGESRKLTPGLAALRDFKLINFENKVSSVNLCPTEDLSHTSNRDVDPRPIRGPISHQFETHPPLEYNNESPSLKKTQTLDKANMQRVRDVAVAEHNKYRQRHTSPPLQGDPTMHDEAQKWAEHLASSNKFELNRNSRWIGNIASSFRRDPEDAVKDVIGRWYDGVNYYDFNNPGFSRNAGSFTAVVWKASTHMGIGLAWNQSQNNWVVISYYTPSPNLQGAFRDNVLPFTH